MSKKIKKAIAINGSPRKNKNTAKLLEHALEGAASKGAETSLIHLNDLNFKGCVSCFACKRNESYRNGKCAMRDDLSPVLEQVMASDVLLLGSPIYLSDVTGAMRSFLERLIFMNAAYETEMEKMSVFGGSIACGCIYTMNITEEEMRQFGYGALFESHAMFLKILRGEVASMTACDTLQFDDYSKYYAPRFDADDKMRVHETQFPKDCKTAFEMGARLTESASKS